MAWKFVILKHKDYEYPVIFPDKFVHADVAKALLSIDNFAKVPPKNIQIVSAGMIEHVDVEGLGGRSTSIGVDSQPNADVRCIEGYPYFHGIINRDYLADHSLPEIPEPKARPSIKLSPRSKFK